MPGAAFIRFANFRPLHVGFVQANCTIRRWLFGEIYFDFSDPTFLLSRLCNLSEGLLSQTSEMTLSTAINLFHHQSAYNICGWSSAGCVPAIIEQQISEGKKCNHGCGSKVFESGSGSPKVKRIYFKMVPDPGKNKWLHSNR